jgi:hypothetical protein
LDIALADQSAGDIGDSCWLGFEGDRFRNRNGRQRSLLCGSWLIPELGEFLPIICLRQRFIGEGCVDVIQPDLSRCGSISVAKQVAWLADSAGIDLVPLSWLIHLLNGYSLQLIATMPRARYLEFNVSQSRLTRGIAQAPFELAARWHRHYTGHACYWRARRWRFYHHPSR